MEHGRVSFLVVGVQKAGTTALDRYLRAHPKLRLPTARKELHFFDDETVDWADPPYADYEAAFTPGVGPSGECTPIYCYWPKALERARAYNPDLKLVMIIRDPVERAWSHWRMETARGAETESFSWCIREGRARLQPDGHHRVYSYVERGYYGAQFRRMTALFPREQILVLTAEALKARPAEVLSQISAFLTVEAFPAELKPITAHRGTEFGRIQPEDERHLQTLYRDDAALFRELTGCDAVADWSASGPELPAERPLAEMSVS